MKNTFNLQLIQHLSTKDIDLTTEKNIPNYLVHLQRTKAYPLKEMGFCTDVKEIQFYNLSP